MMSDQEKTQEIHAMFFLESDNGPTRQLDRASSLPEFNHAAFSDKILHGDDRHLNISVLERDVELVAIFKDVSHCGLPAIDNVST